MDGTYRVPNRRNAVTHGADRDAGGIVTLCGREYPLDDNFNEAPRVVTCGICKAKQPKPSPPAIGGTWEGPTVYASRAALIDGGLLKTINTAISSLAIFAELQPDGSLRILDYRRLPNQAAALAAVVNRTQRQPA